MREKAGKNLGVAVPTAGLLRETVKELILGEDGKGEGKVTA